MNRKTVLDHMKSSEMTALLAIVGLALVFNVFNHNFLTVVNITAMMRGMAYAGIISVGMALCLISGLIDVSIGAGVAMVNCFFAWMIITAGVPPLPAILASLALGVLASVVNVTIILRTKITSFISTISMMYVLRGVANFISNGGSIYPLPKIWQPFNDIKPLGTSVAFILFLVIVIIGELALRHTVWGLEVRATGSDREIARDTEVRVDFVNYSCFVVLGLLSAITAILIAIRTNGGLATTGQGMEFRSIVGCALGGVSIFGYEGTIMGAALGITLSQVIASGMIAVGLPIASQDIILGSLLIAVIALDIYKQRLKPKVKKEKTPRCSELYLS